MSDRRPASSLWLLALLVTGRFLLPLLLIHPEWEFHRDELLYFAMADHLDFFRMQFPPFIAVAARAGSLVFGDAVWAARVPAAVGGAALLGVMLLVARRLGGGSGSLVLIALASVSAPVLLRPSVLFQPVVFDQLWCTVAVAGVMLAGVDDEPRWWLVAGAALGLGALTKFSAIFYAACLAAAVLFVPVVRRQLATRWPWLAAALAMFLAIPSLTGQIANGWPFPAQMAVLRTSQLERVEAVSFLAEQPLMMGAAMILVILGLAAAITDRPGRRVPALFGGMLVLLMLALGGKPYYAAPAYPLLLVTGTLMLERWTRVPHRRPFAWACALLLVAGASLLLPMGVPLLGPEAMTGYAGRLGLSAPVRTNRGELLALPQDYADMLGWRAQAAAVAAVHDSLSDADRQQLVVVARNYGEAGALAVYRRRFGYPYPVAVAGDFHAWGFGSNSGEVGIMLGRAEDARRLEEIWTDVQVVRSLGDPRGVPEERDLRIFVMRGLRRPLPEVWPLIGPVWG